MPFHTSFLSFLALAWLIFIVTLKVIVPDHNIVLNKDSIRHEIGCSYSVDDLNGNMYRPFIKLQGDSMSFPEISQINLLEDGIPIGAAHALHDTIRTIGDGHFSHWGNSLLFSTSDCTSPVDNGRRYEITGPANLAGWVVISGFIAAWILGAMLATNIHIKNSSLSSILSDSRINYYFIFSFAIIVVSVLIKIPSLVISAEFYAETATIFFKEAMEASLWQILTYTWADYLVTLQLLVSFIVVRLFGVVDYFPGTVNFIFLVFVGFTASLINMRIFRSLIGSDFLRFILGLSIGLTPNYELYELLNSNLFGVMIFLLLIFVDKSGINKWLFLILTGLLFFTGISRPNMVAFIPVYLVLLVIAVKQNNLRDKIFYFAGSLSLCLQAYVMVMAQLFWSFRMDMNIYNEITGIESIIQPLGSAIYHYFRTLLTVLYIKQVSGLVPVVVLSCVMLLILSFACYFLYKRKKYPILYYFAVSQVIAFGMIYFITFSSPLKFDWSQMYYMPMRWWSYSNYVIYLSLIVLAYNFFKEILPDGNVISSKRITFGHAILLLSLTAFIYQIYPFYQTHDVYGGKQSVSNWEKYRFLLNNEDYYIPVNPVQSLQWGLARDNQKLQTDNRFDTPVDGIRIGTTDGDLQLRSIMVVNKSLSFFMKNLIIMAYDKEGRELGSPERLNDFDEKYLYYYFPERIRPYSLRFFDEKITPVSIGPAIHLYGKLETGEKITITSL